MHIACPQKIAALKQRNTLKEGFELQRHM